MDVTIIVSKTRSGSAVQALYFGGKKNNSTLLKKKIDCGSHVVKEEIIALLAEPDPNYVGY